MIGKVLLYFQRRRKNQLQVSKCAKMGLLIDSPFEISNINHIISDCRVGKYCYIGPSSWLELRGFLFIGSGTIIGPRLKVHTANHQ